MNRLQLLLSVTRMHGLTMLKNRLAALLVVPLFAAIAVPAHAQDIDRAIEAYKGGNYEDSASLFYAILRFEDDAGLVAESQYGLASSFDKLGLKVAALKYYEDIVKEGSDHPYFDQAVDGLLGVAVELKDDLKIPPVVDGLYDDNLSAIEKMDPELRQRMHFVIAKYAFQRGNIRDARDFLKTVKEGNPAYAQAQYLLGLIRLGVGRIDAPKPKYDKAFDHFENVLNTIDIQTSDPEERILRDLATLGVARSQYEEAYLLEDGDPKRAALLGRAINLYRQIPRFSDAWAQALFERAYAHTVNNEYGKALGAMQSLKAPFFSDVFLPEAEILTAIIYYYNCQWDRVNKQLEATRAKYGPMVEKLSAVLEVDYAFDEWYALLNKSLEAGPGHNDDTLIPWIVAKHITRDPKFQKLDGFLRQLEKEADVFQNSAAFGRSDMGREMTDFALETREAFLQVLGKYVRTKLKDVTSELSDITTRASLVSLETKTAETEWLEVGREIGGHERAKLPRPYVPDETFQFWWFRGEYWQDELGYYEAKIKTECFE